jgi:hypothetical protein
MYALLFPCGPWTECACAPACVSGCIDNCNNDQAETGTCLEVCISPPSSLFQAFPPPHMGALPARPVSQEMVLDGVRGRLTNSRWLDGILPAMLG